MAQGKIDRAAVAQHAELLAGLCRQKAVASADAKLWLTAAQLLDQLFITGASTLVAPISTITSPQKAIPNSPSTRDDANAQAWIMRAWKFAPMLDKTRLQVHRGLPPLHSSLAALCFLGSLLQGDRNPLTTVVADEAIQKLSFPWLGAGSTIVQHIYKPFRDVWVAPMLQE